MLQGVERLHRELARISRPRKATITLTPGGPAVEVEVGDEIEFDYEGERRRVRVLAITEWGLRAWDEDRRAMRSFSFTKIGSASDGTPADEETGEAAQG